MTVKHQPKEAQTHRTSWLLRAYVFGYRCAPERFHLQSLFLPAQLDVNGDSGHATTHCTHPCCHYSRFTHHLLQIVEQGQGDNPAEGLCHGDRTRVDGTVTVIKCARDGDPTATTAAGNVGPCIAVPF